MKKDTQLINVSARLPYGLIKRIKMMAAADKRTFSFMLRLLLEDKMSTK